jgi:hypothetical protein
MNLSHDQLRRCILDVFLSLITVIFHYEANVDQDNLPV